MIFVDASGAGFQCMIFGEGRIRNDGNLIEVDSYQNITADLLDTVICNRTETFFAGTYFKFINVTESSRPFYETTDGSLVLHFSDETWIVEQSGSEIGLASRDAGGLIPKDFQTWDITSGDLQSYDSVRVYCGGIITCINFCLGEFGMLNAYLLVSEPYCFFFLRFFNF